MLFYLRYTELTFLYYFHKLNPFSPKKTEKQKMMTWQIWIKVLIGCVPAAVIGLLFDDIIDKVLYHWYVVAAMLIVYGVLFIVVENYQKGKEPKVKRISQLTVPMLLIIGVFQMLALIPGTSRSGATIVGALLIGVSRGAAAEFTFYLAIPFIKFGCLKDDKFADKMDEYIIFKNLEGKYLTLKDCEERAKEENHENKIFYVTDEKEQSQYINMFKESGQDALILPHNIDNPFIGRLEQKHENLKFFRIDADVNETMKEEVAEEDKESFKKTEETLTEVFRKALGDAR